PLPCAFEELLVELHLGPLPGGGLGRLLGRRLGLRLGLGLGLGRREGRPDQEDTQGEWEQPAVLARIRSHGWGPREAGGFRRPVALYSIGVQASSLLRGCAL